MKPREAVALKQQRHTALDGGLFCCFQGIFLFCLAFGWIGEWNRFLNLEVPMEVLAGRVAVYCLAAGIGMSVSRWRHIGTAFLAAFLLVRGITQRQVLFCGFGTALQRFLDHYNEYFQTSLYCESISYVLAAPEQPFLLFAAAGMIFLCALSMFFARSALVPAFFVLLECVLILMVGHVPDLGFALWMSAGVMGIWILGGGQSVLWSGMRAIRMHTSDVLRCKSALQKMAFMMGLAAAAAVLTKSFLLDPCFALFEQNRDLYWKIRENGIETVIEGWTQISNPIWEPFSEQSSMGISGGEIGQADSVKGTNEVDLVVTVSGEWDGPMYLKAFAASIYEGDGWGQIPTAGAVSAMPSEQVLAQRRELQYGYLSGYLCEAIDEGRADRISWTGNMKKKAVLVERKNADGAYEYIPYFSHIQGKEHDYDYNGWMKGKGSSSAQYEVMLASLAEMRTVMQYAESGEITLHNSGDLISIISTEYPQETLAPIREAFFRETGVSSSWNFTQVTQAIRSYLHQTAVYSTSPGKTPTDRDFVEYFLTEQKRGYCVHFATAAAILYRMCGYATRYVEGYVTEAVEAGTPVEIKNRQAHAWVEVYHSAIGWIPVEMTPGYSNLDRQDLLPETTEEEVESQTEPQTQPQETTEPTPEEPQTTQTESSQETDTDSQTDLSGPGSSDLTPGEQRTWMIAGGVLLALLFIVSGMVIRSRILLSARRKKARHPVWRLAILNEYEMTCRLARHLGIEMGVECSAEQMHLRIQALKVSQLEEWKKTVLKAYFSADEMTWEEKNAVRDVYRAVYQIAQTHAAGKLIQTFWYAYPKI